MDAQEIIDNCFKTKEEYYWELQDEKWMNRILIKELEQERIDSEFIFLLFQYMGENIIELTKENNTLKEQIESFKVKDKNKQEEVANRLLKGFKPVKANDKISKNNRKIYRNSK